MIRAYLHSLGEKLAVGDSTEHTHRPALQAVMESFGGEYVVSNEPKRIKVGAPDLIVRKRISKHELLTVGYIETKDIGEDLSGDRTLIRRAYPTANVILEDGQLTLLSPPLNFHS